MSCRTCQHTAPCSSCRPRRRAHRRPFGALEATCSGKYKDLVRNGKGGYLDKPCANESDSQWYCNQSDADAWMITADDLFAKVRSAWNQTAGGGFVIPAPIKAYIVALETDYCDADDKGVCVTFKLPASSWYDVNHNAKASIAIAKWCSRAACALELLDQVRGGAGLPVEQQQKNTPTPPLLGLGSTAMWIGGGLLLLLLLRR